MMVTISKEPNKQFLALVPEPLARALKKQLVDDGLTYRAWLRRRIEVYLRTRTSKAP